MDNITKVGTTAEVQRDKKIVTVSAVGIAANALLAAFKVIVGLTVNSIAIIMDAVNNISDAASSVITIVGTKLAGKRPNKKHPFGYGRVEYFSSMLISVIVLYAGVTSLVESVKKIIHPEKPEYSTISIIIVSVAVVVKIILGLYVSKAGKKVNSDSLVNSGKDALMDSVISFSTVVAAIIFISFGISLEAPLGAIISLFIIKSGVEMLLETISKLLGQKAEPELARNIKNHIVENFDIVNGVHDLILHDYGPESTMGSLHIEVPETLSAMEIDKLLRDITVEIYLKFSVTLTAVGIYAENEKGSAENQIKEEIKQLVLSFDSVLALHGFYVNLKAKTMRFDVVISLGAKNPQKDFESICKTVKEKYPEFELNMVMDTDFSEE